MKNALTSLILAFVPVVGFTQTYIIKVKTEGSSMWGFANIRGEMIIPPKFKYCDSFSADGVVTAYEPKGDKVYFFNVKGELLAPTMNFIYPGGFDYPTFCNGMAPVSTGNGKWGYLNTEGKVVVPFKYERTYEFRNGTGFAENDGHYFILKPNGEDFQIEITDISTMRRFEGGLAPYQNRAGKWGYIDPAGKAVVLAQFYSVGYFVGSAAWVRNDEFKVGFIKPTGEWIARPQFDKVGDFDPVSGMARVKTDKEGWRYMDMSGLLFRFDETSLFGNFSEGLALGRKDGQVGFFNNKFQWVIAPQFKGAREFRNGFAAVRKDELWGVIDREGKWVIEPKFTEIRDVEMVK
jgi:hypothetical protein